MNKGYWWFAKLDKTWSIDNPYFISLNLQIN